MHRYHCAICSYVHSFHCLTEIHYSNVAGKQVFSCSNIGTLLLPCSCKDNINQSINQSVNQSYTALPPMRGREWLICSTKTQKDFYKKIQFGPILGFRENILP